MQAVCYTSHLQRLTPDWLYEMNALYRPAIATAAAMPPTTHPAFPVIWTIPPVLVLLAAVAVADPDPGTTPVVPELSLAVAVGPLVDAAPVLLAAVTVGIPPALAIEPACELAAAPNPDEAAAGPKLVIWFAFVTSVTGTKREATSEPETEVVITPASSVETSAPPRDSTQETEVVPARAQSMEKETESGTPKE